MKVIKRNINFVFIISTLLLMSLLFFYLFNSKITGHVVEDLTGESNDPSLVLKLTFDDFVNPWKDYSMYNHKFETHKFETHGTVGWLSKENCKWYGCANFSALSGDYINSSTQFKLDSGLAVSFWIYETTAPSGSSGMSQSHFQIGTGNNLKYIEEGDYGLDATWKASTGTAGGIVGSAYSTSLNSWTQYFLLYDHNNYIVWKNGVILKNTTQNFGKLNYEVGEILNIGQGVFGIDTHGYLDEFYVYNRTNFTSKDVIDIYARKKLGTPPNLDLYVKSIKYSLPRNWGVRNNSLILGSIPIIVTIRNEGILPSSNFNYNVLLDGNSICSGRTSMAATSEINVTCSWISTYGFHKGKILLDSDNEINEDNEYNNNQTLYIPFLDRPYMFFNLTEWENTLKPYCETPSNSIAFNSCDFYKNFVSEDFNNGWSGNSVDPRGKKGRENAIGCMYNNYDMSKTQC